MLQNVHCYLVDRTNNYVACFPVADIQTFADKAAQLCQQHKADYLVLNAGTNNIESEDFSTVQWKFCSAVNLIRWSSLNTIILLSSIVHRLDKSYLNSRVDPVNNFILKLENDKAFFYY